MAIESFLAVSCGCLPESDGFISGAREDHITFGVETDI